MKEDFDESECDSDKQLDFTQLYEKRMKELDKDIMNCSIDQ